VKSRKKEDKEREKRDMGLSEQRSWKDKDHIAFFKKQELLMMSHYTHTHTLRFSLSSLKNTTT